MRHLNNFAGTLVAVALSTAAQAQSTTQPDPVAASQEQENADIIVTAQKREERLVDVPIAITALSGERLNSTGAKNLTELQGVVPGIYFSGNSGYGGSPIGIRGTSGATSPLLDDPVAVYVNGVYQSSSGVGQATLIDISSVEVVRGPQGTLQGRNATAGAVLLNTALPTRDLGGFVRATIADPTEIRVEGAVGGPLTDTLGLRVAAGYTKENGWARNTVDGSRLGGGRSFSGRATLQWQPTSDIDIRLIGAHLFNLTRPALARYAVTPFNPSPTGQLVLPGTATPTVPLPPAEQSAITGDHLFALNRPADFRITDDSVVLNATWNVGPVDLISVTGYNKTKNRGRGDSDGLGRTDRDGFNVASLPSRVFSQEVRVQSSGQRSFNWILGGYYSSAIQVSDFTISNLQFTSPARVSTRFISSQDTRSYAAFADGTLKIAPEFSVIGGVRYTRETKDFSLVRTIGNFDTGAPVPPAPPLFTYSPGQAVFTNTSFRAKATYQPSRDLLFYLSYSTGFKSGGFNAFGNDPAFDPERLKSAEAGIKADLFDHMVTMALSAYTNRYSGLQIRAGVPSGGVAITNAADSKIDGFEFEGTVRPHRDVALTGNLAFTNARFTRFPNARNLLDQGPIDATGNILPRSPKWQYYIQASYTPELGSNVQGLFEASYRYRSTVYYYHTDQFSPTIQGKPLGELGLRAGLTFVPEQLTISAYATNLNNGRSVTAEIVNFSYPVASFNKPRSIGVQIEKKF